MTDDILFALPTLPSGAVLAVAACPGRNRGAAEDVAAYSAWGATAVLTLTEAHELPDEAGLEAALGAAGIAWHRLPIADYGVVSSQTEWERMAPALHAILDRGGRLVCHCWGGRGRSGRVAVRLLVERGVAAEAATEAVRMARPGAVETPEQQAWACEPARRAAPG